ncbi:MAG TPA: hypothetical protein VM364_05940 [Vicinamibacterales bacterium]|nr:hypothetical protein [Vicinamibacterales bacterium]
MAARRLPEGRARFSDSSADAERIQIDAWRALTTVERAALIAGASRAVREMALRGVRARHPEAPEHALAALLAEVTLGPELARRVYPDILVTAIPVVD